MSQSSFYQTKRRHRFSHGGQLRQERAGRGARPLSSRSPLHLVFKAKRSRLRTSLRGYRSHRLIVRLLERYGLKFFIKIEQVSIQGDHIHLLIRTGRRSNYQSFFRVVAGQIAQQFEREGWLHSKPGATSGTVVTDTPGARRSREKLGGRAKRRGTGLWLHRPFSRVVLGWRAIHTVKAYIRLNEKEATGEIPYRKSRLRGLSPDEWRILWS